METPLNHFLGNTIKSLPGKKKMSTRSSQRELNTCIYVFIQSYHITLLLLPKSYRDIIHRFGLTEVIWRVLAVKKQIILLLEFNHNNRGMLRRKDSERVPNEPICTIQQHLSKIHPLRACYHSNTVPEIYLRSLQSSLFLKCFWLVTVAHA